MSFRHYVAIDLYNLPQTLDSRLYKQLLCDAPLPSHIRNRTIGPISEHRSIWPKSNTVPPSGAAGFHGQRQLHETLLRPKHDASAFGWSHTRILSF